MNRRRSSHSRNPDFYGGLESSDTIFESQFELEDFFNPRMNRSNRRMDTSHGQGHGMKMSTCQELADIIGGEVVTATPVCVVQRLRNIRATILGRSTRSPLALPFALSFENNGLNLGESVLLEREADPMMDALRRRGLIVTALHNHWLFEEPRLMYMHWENVGLTPKEFARKSISAFREAGLY